MILSLFAHCMTRVGHCLFLFESFQAILKLHGSSLLEMAQRTTQANHDPFKDDLKIHMEPFNLISELFRIMQVSHDYKGNARGVTEFFSTAQFQLPAPVVDSVPNAPSSITGYEALTLEYDVGWPVSLVLNKVFMYLIYFTCYCNQILIVASLASVRLSATSYYFVIFSVLKMWNVNWA
jgi:Gamma tubulin complex component C-terminal